jgi:tripartite-type tricarboxylate transporter receptor subunit TctC
MCSIGPITIAPATQHLRYDPLKDLVPISLVSTNPLMLVVHPSVKANSVQELVALARAEPGRLNYSSAGIGALTYFSAELFKTKTGTQITHVAYRGGAQATMAVIAGDVQLTFANMSDAVSQIEGGKVRALGVTPPSAALPHRTCPRWRSKEFPAMQPNPERAVRAEGHLCSNHRSTDDSYL